MNPKLLLLFFFIFFAPALAKCQALQWAGKIGGTQPDIGSKTAVDGNGNLYLVGNFRGTNVDFDPGAGSFFLTSAGSKDGFVAKYDKNGNFKWAFKIGGANLDEVNDITVNHAGDLIIAGYFRGPNVDFNPSPAVNALSSNGEAGGDPGYGGDIFVAKYDTLGNYKWAFNVGGAYLGDNATCLTVDNNDNIIASGYFTDVVDFDPSAGNTSLTWTTGTVFIAKYNTTGAFQWAFNFGAGTTDNSSSSVITDNANNIIATGFFQGTNIDFNPGLGSNLLSSAGSLDFFVAKYNASGQYIWAQRAGGVGADVGRAVAVDGANDIYVTGDYTSATINFNGSATSNNLINNGLNDLFLTKYSASGQHQWSFSVGGSDYEFGTTVALDYQNNVLITGTFSGANVDFDPSVNTVSLSSAGGNDIFAVKYSPAGNYLCGFRVGGAGNDVGRGLNTYNQYFYLAGQFNGNNINFSPGGNPTLLSTQSDDAFISKYDWTIVPPAGSITGASNCITGISQLTFNATSGTPPFTLHVSNGSNTTIYNNIQSGVPFALTPSPTGPTTYTLTGIRDAQLCGALAPANSSILLSPGTLPITTSGNVSICKADSAQLSASGGITYQWSPAGGLNNPSVANPKASPAVSTVYKVIVTNSAGCKDSSTLSVTLKPSPVIVVLPVVAAFCPGDSVQLTASGGDVYSWYPSVGLSNPLIANPIAAPPATTVYKLIVTTAEGCLDSITKSVVRNVKPIVAVSPASSICPGDSAQLSAAGGSMYQWTPATSLSNAAIATPKASPFATTTYKVVVSNSQGCTDSATTVLSVKPKPHATVSNSASVCVADSAQLAASGGTGYLWSPTNGLNNPGIGNPKASPSVTTIYTVYVVGANGCRDSGTTTVTINAKPIIIISPPGTICNGDSLQLNASGGTGYQWSPMAGLSNANVASPKASPAVSTTYKLIAVSAAGCNDSSSVAITVNPKPTIVLSGPQSICRGDTAQLTASGGVAYAWAPAVSLSNASSTSPRAFPLSTTTYQLNVTNAAACRDSTTYTLAVTPAAFVSLGSDTTLCSGETIRLNAALPGGSSWLWSTGATTPGISITQAGIYTVSAQAIGCVAAASDTIKISNLPSPTVKLPPDTAICAFSTILLKPSSTDVSKWLWINNTTDSFLLVSVPGHYRVAVMNKCGSDAASIIIGDAFCSDDLFFPTGFTPNNDGSNDLFKAGYLNGFKVYEYTLSIYNRWGQQVFQTNEVANGWNGIFHGQFQSTGVFVWIASYKKSPSGIKMKKKGTVVLIR